MRLHLKPEGKTAEDKVKLIGLTTSSRARETKETLTITCTYQVVTAAIR